MSTNTYIKQAFKNTIYLIVFFIFGFLALSSGAQIVDVKANAALDTKNSSSLNNSRSSASDKSIVGQAPLIIIKKNTAVSAVTQGWAVGEQNVQRTIVVPGRGEGQSGGNASTVTLKQNPTGSNVKTNENALTQPPTILISLPTCTGGQVLTGSVCACPAGQTWNGSTCIVQPLCNSLLPANSSSLTACTVYYGSIFWTGNVVNSITWSCPSTYGVPVSTPSVDTSGCVPIAPCTLPANSSDVIACSTYYGNPAYTGSVISTSTWSCPSPIGSPIVSVSVNNSGCVLPPTCTQTPGSQTSNCSAGFTGTRTRSTSTNSCTGAVTYGSWDTSSCVPVGPSCVPIPGW